MESQAARSEGIRSNLEHWKEVQDAGYFETHPCYNGLTEFGGDGEVAMTERFVKLSPETVMAVIGCGYGRESLAFAKRVKRIYGIDVTPTILAKAVRFISERGVTNFHPVLADEYKAKIPDGLDLVFSIVVMQHLTRDLVRDYFMNLGHKLSADGSIVIQFLEDLIDFQPADAELRAYEPSVSWNMRQLVELARETGLQVVEIISIVATPTCMWHWGHFKRA